MKLRMSNNDNIKTYWYISWGWVLAGMFAVAVAAGAVAF